jgi:hypothetical protein
MANATVMTTEALTDEMDVIEYTTSFSPESSQMEGERIARMRGLMGWACECIGVVTMVKEVGFERFPQTVYHPVIFPKPPTVKS